MYEIEDGKIADIFILDVEMPNMNGFELADKIREYTETSVIIFLTSHDEMALMGYKSKALRYVIKLNLERDIEEALDSAVTEMSNAEDKTITLHYYNDYWRIPFKDIICVTRISRQLVITTRLLGEITDNRGIKEFFDMLGDNRFLFIDRSCFVNIDYISQINGYNLKLTDGQLLPISRRSLQNVKQTLLEQWG
jgi:DNA-binding LytR/AlgR family response regulator